VPLNVVILLGHVLVPYSGPDFAEDFHVDCHPGSSGQAGNHRGAWPADAFYGDTSRHDAWRDEASFPNCEDPPNGPYDRIRNGNAPGDGRRDELFLPSEPGSA